MSREDFERSESSMIFDLGDVVAALGRGEDEDSTRNDILPYKKRKLQAARASQSIIDVVSPRRRGQNDATKEIQAQTDEWDEATLLKDKRDDWDESTLVDEGQGMAKAQDLIASSRAPEVDDDEETRNRHGIRRSRPASEPPRRNLARNSKRKPARFPLKTLERRPRLRSMTAALSSPSRSCRGRRPLQSDLTRQVGISRLRRRSRGKRGTRSQNRRCAGRWQDPRAPESGWDRRRTVSFIGRQHGPSNGERAIRSLGRRCATLHAASAGRRPLRCPAAAGPAARASGEARAAALVATRWGGPLRARRRRRGRRVAGARPKPTTFEIISVPEGASVRVDGRPLAEATPVVLPDVVAGRTYRVELTHPGYEPNTADLKAEKGANRRVFLLNPIRVRLRIQTEPAGGQVWVDNVLRGSAPLEIPGLAVGQRLELRGSAPGREQVTREIVLSEEERQPRVVLELPPAR